MHLPADRRRLERILRAIALAALALWIANAARPRARRFEAVQGTALAAALPRWTTGSLDSVQVHLDTAPDAVHAAWLAALRDAGVGVSWTGSSVPPLAVETYTAADPAGGLFVLANSPAGASPLLSDALGDIDTLSGGAVTSRVTALQGSADVRVGDQHARADVAAARTPRRAYVTGAAGWEAKFVIAALEESGWTVDARLFVGPDQDVWQGGGARVGGRLDTSRHATAVLLDSLGAERVRDLEPFVRTGGGVVIAGDASRAQRVANLVAWRAGRREAAPLGTLPGDTAWRGLSRIALDPISERRAIPLEFRGGMPIVAARRYHAGRVIGVGYDETWRWRMSGGDEGPAAHREWWSRVVGSVALRPTTGGPSGAAPLASLYATLGPPTSDTRSLTASLPAALLSNLLGAICLTALLGEWLLRRARGAR